MIVIILLATVFIVSLLYFVAIGLSRISKYLFSKGIINVLFDNADDLGEALVKWNTPIKWFKAKLILSATIAFLSFAMGLMLICDKMVSASASDQCYNEISELPHVRAAILLGTSIKGRYTPTNPYFRPRINGVLSQYRSGKIDQVYITGDSAKVDYNEPRWMADS